MDFQQLEPYMEKLEALRDHMVATLAKTYVTPYSDESTRDEDLERGLKHYGAMSFADLFIEYENEVRREERARAWEEARMEYAPTDEELDAMGRWDVRAASADLIEQATTCAGYSPAARHEYVEEQQAREEQLS